jgi:hypothetical protein
MNTLITPEQMADNLKAMVKEHANGDPEAEAVLWEYLSALFFQL